MKDTNEKRKDDGLVAGDTIQLKFFANKKNEEQPIGRTGNGKICFQHAKSSMFAQKLETWNCVVVLAYETYLIVEITDFVTSE